MHDTTTVTSAADSAGGLPDPTLRVALIVLWSTDPDRIGETALLPRGVADAVATLGRGSGGDDADRLRWVHQRPGANIKRPSRSEAGVSRQQLMLRWADGWSFENTGRCKLRRNGRVTSSGPLTADDVLHLEGQLVLLVGRRPARMSPARDYPQRKWPAFGRADGQGIVGESPRAWALRDRLAFFSQRSAHVLLLGASGTGKELAAQTIHALSSRSRSKLVSRNAATIPEGLVDAELFGNVGGYPNPGMKDRPGLIGRANGSTLFLDEIGELPTELQAHLLRVLDAGGEYQRLGEAQTRAADLRLVAATNRDPSELKHDLLARFGLRLTVPGLDERIEDVPLLARHLLLDVMARDARLKKRFAADGPPRMTDTLVAALARHGWALHARELMNVLWVSLSSSTGDVVALTPEVEDALQLESVEGQKDPSEVTGEEIQAALARHGGRQKDAWRELGLSSRHQLARLMKKHGLAVKK